jgi:hypothetical protein
MRETLLIDRFPRKMVFVFCISIALSGCANRTVVTGLPAGVTNAQINAWTSSVSYLKNISDLTHAVQVAVITANRNGLFKDGLAYASTVTAIGRADALELQATQFLQSVPNSFGQPIQTQLMSYTTQILSQLQLASSQQGIPANIVTNIAAIIAEGIQIEQLIQSLTSWNLLQRRPIVCGTSDDAPQFIAAFILAGEIR